MDHGVVWIPLKIKEDTILDETKEFIQNYIKENVSVAILYNFDKYNPLGSKKLAENIKDINKDYLGPYYEDYFNGKEAEVIVLITSSGNGLYIQSMSRARRLLIIITHGSSWLNESNYYVKSMNAAVMKNLVKKI